MHVGMPEDHVFPVSRAFWNLFVKCSIEAIDHSSSGGSTSHLSRTIFQNPAKPTVCLRIARNTGAPGQKPPPGKSRASQQPDIGMSSCYANQSPTFTTQPPKISQNLFSLPMVAMAGLLPNEDLCWSVVHRPLWPCSISFPSDRTRTPTGELQPPFSSAKPSTQTTLADWSLLVHPAQSNTHVLGAAVSTLFSLYQLFSLGVYPIFELCAKSIDLPCWLPTISCTVGMGTRKRRSTWASCFGLFGQTGDISLPKTPWKPGFESWANFICNSL